MLHLRCVTTQRSVAGHWREVREVEVTTTATTTRSGSHCWSLLGQILLLDLRGEIGRRGRGVVVRRGLEGLHGRDVVAEGRGRARDVGTGPCPSHVGILERLLRNSLAHNTWGSRETCRTTTVVNNSTIRIDISISAEISHHQR